MSLQPVEAQPLKRRDSHVWKRDEHDWYLEPSWTSERLFDEERFDGGIWDPACGEGRIIDAAKSRSVSAVGTDLIDRANGRFQQLDFMEKYFRSAPNIVSNPPFKHAEAFVARALKLATGKVAMLLPLTWMSRDARSRWLEGSGLRRVWVITPRPSMPPGTAIAAGHKPGQGSQDFAWFVWLKGYDGHPETRWLRRNT